MWHFHSGASIRMQSVFGVFPRLKLVWIHGQMHVALTGLYEKCLPYFPSKAVGIAVLILKISPCLSVRLYEWNRCRADLLLSPQPNIRDCNSFRLPVNHPDD